MKRFVCTAAVVLLTAWTAAAQSRLETLKEAYKDYFTIGVAVEMGDLLATDKALQIKQMYNGLSAENDMKPISLQPREGVWRWSNADNIARFAAMNGMPLRGHCLIWYKQVGEWMFYDDKGKLVSKEVLYERMRTHIHTVMKRYKGRVYAWDVVNEAITIDPEAEDPYRPSLFYEIAGEEYIRKAFEFAREADPDALLFYNDFNEFMPYKRDHIYNMVKKMKADGVPIDGIGMQGHYNIAHPTEDEFRKALELFSSVVDHIHITEMDVRVNAGLGGGLVAEEDTRGLTGVTELTPEIAGRQADQYEMLFRVMREYKDVIGNVTFWNTDDKETWLDRRAGAEGRTFPLLFDDDRQPKPAYYRVIDF